MKIIASHFPEFLKKSIALVLSCTIAFVPLSLPSAWASQTSSDSDDADSNPLVQNFSFLPLKYFSTISLVNHHWNQFAKAYFCPIFDSIKRGRYFLNLPLEIKVYIFSFLNRTDLLFGACLVSREWKTYAFTALSDTINYSTFKTNLEARRLDEIDEQERILDLQDLFAKKGKKKIGKIWEIRDYLFSQSRFSKKGNYITTQEIEQYNIYLVDTNSCSLGISDVKILVNSKLRAIRITRLLGSEQFFQLALGLMKNKTLISLDLSGLSIKYSSICQLSLGLSQNTSLQSLILQRNQLYDPAIITLVTALKFSSTLTSLDLQQNNISSTGAEALAELETLKILNLGENSIKINGLISLLGSPSIEDLLLSNNSLSDAPFSQNQKIKVFELLEHSPLKTITLEKCCNNEAEVDEFTAKLNELKIKHLVSHGEWEID
jgi:hypothetical protein